MQAWNQLFHDYSVIRSNDKIIKTDYTIFVFDLRRNSQRFTIYYSLSPSLASFQNLEEGMQLFMILPDAPSRSYFSACSGIRRSDLPDQNLAGHTINQQDVIKVRLKKAKPVDYPLQRITRRMTVKHEQRVIPHFVLRIGYLNTYPNPISLR
jgi:hypothetical protein